MINSGPACEPIALHSRKTSIGTGGDRTCSHPEGTSGEAVHGLPIRFPMGCVASCHASGILAPEAGIPGADAVYIKLGGVSRGRDAVVADSGTPTL